MKFKKKKKRITVGTTPGIKFMAQIVKGETITFKTMAAMIEKSSTVSKGDILNVLDSVTAQTIFMLQAGHSVKYDGLGTFNIRTKVKAVDTIEEVTAETVERVGIGFSPEIDFKNQIKTVPIHIEDTEDSTT
jgi:predicted histone-like DNA-binding protein